MAPIKKRTTMRAKVAASSKPKPAYTPSAPSTEPITTHSFPRQPDSEFSNTKKDKRAIKHNALVSRIEKANTKTLKRRRPSKKLTTQLEGLAAALPDIADREDDEWEGIDDSAPAGDDMFGELSKMVRVRKPRQEKMQLKTLKSRPGALKRKAKMEEKEMERFGKNLASMASAETTNEGPQATADRWKALRGFIGQTMEQNAAFKKA